MNSYLKDFIDHRVRLKERAEENGFSWETPDVTDYGDVDNEQNIILVVGRGHTHNEFLSWVFNNSLAVQNRECEYLFEPYPSIFGTFMRHSDDAFHCLQYPSFTQMYNESYREALIENHHKYTREQFDGLLEAYHYCGSWEYGPLSVYINCTNPIEVAKWADEVGIQCFSSDPDFPNSRIRSHYIQMEFSPGAAEDVDYEELEWSDADISDFLFMFHNQDLEEKQKIEEEGSSLIKVNINKLFDLDKEYIEEIFSKVDLFQPNWGRLMERIHDFEFINFPQNETMQRFNQMDWDEIRGMISPDDKPVSPHA